MKLPPLEELEHISEATETSVDKTLLRTEKIVQRLMLNLEAFRKIESDNKALRNLLLQNQSDLRGEFEKKLRVLTNKVREEHELLSKRHRDLVKESEEVKLELKKKLALEKEKNDFLARKLNESVSTSKQLALDNRNLKKTTQTVLERMKLLEEKSLANQDVLGQKVEEVKAMFESQLQNVTKTHLNKEVEYKAQIDSLRQDLKEYYHELKEQRERYYKREKELKQKISEVIKID